MTPANQLLKDISDPKVLAVKMMVEKNQWLTRIRWLYSIFIFFFFFTYNYFSDTNFIGYRTLALILGLSVFGNIIFSLTLKRSLKFNNGEKDLESFISMASLQLDFDLVSLALLIYYSGGFDSPMKVLLIFYIMVAAFMINYNKALKKTLTAIVLVIVIFFSQGTLVLSSGKFTEIVAFCIILIFAFFISAYLSGNLGESEKSLQALLEKTRELSVTDRLTNLYDHAHFFMLLNLQLEKARRYSKPFTIIMFDLDYFKNYNDNNGHMKGSEALQRIADLMRQVFRTSDILAKYGGDEFVIILPESDHVGAYLAADRLRETVEDEPFEGREKQPDGKVTISLGIASYPEHGSDGDEILNNADKALYMAKKRGRNRTIIYNEKEYDLTQPK